MHKLGGVLIGLAASISVAGSAFAEDFNATVGRGGVLKVPFYSYTSDCYAGGMHKLEVVDAPAHGRITTGFEEIVDSDGKCKGTKFRAHVLRYTPAKGFKGQDVFVIRHGYNRDDSFMKLTWSTYRLFVDVE